MKSKLIKRIGTTTILLLSLISLIIWINHSKQISSKENDEECSTCTVEHSQKPISAYDYIIQTMNEPEYWGIEHMSDYFTEEEIQERLEDIPNGSGWKLKNANTASFIRGHDKKLIYNFSDFTATWYMEELSDFLTIYDFKNNFYTTYSENGEIIDQKNLINDFNNPLIDTLYQSGSLDNFDGTTQYIYSYIKNSMLNYAYLFEQAGCPVLLQPEGTLESYKDKMIIPVENYQKINMNYEDYYDARKNINDSNGNPYADSSKIDAPWELEGYCYDIREKTDLQWIDDYTKVASIAEKLPELTYEINHEKKDVSQAMIIFVNKDYYEEYLETFHLEVMYPNKTSNFFTYYARPILQKIYEKDVVYYFDEGDHNNPNVLHDNQYDIEKPTDSDWAWFPDDKEKADTQVTVYRTPKGPFIGPNNSEHYIKYWFHDLENTTFKGNENECFSDVEEALIAAGVENPFSDIYKFNLLLTIDDNLQENLGLR